MALRIRSMGVWKTKTSKTKTSKAKTSKTMTSKTKTSKTKTSKAKTTKTKTSKTKTSKTIPHIHRYTEETESKLFNVDIPSGQFIEQKYFSNPFSGDRDDRIFNDRDDRIIFGTLFQNL